MSDVERNFPEETKQSSGGSRASRISARVAVEIAARSLEEKGDRLCDPDCARAMRAMASNGCRANADLFAVADRRHRFPPPTD
ncbi:hypothetical protein DIE14_01370 [Burkholderia sp. Bp9017]|uniref:hypothetical protein n=1 Tax=unclassified Burkholderia TaxID=2613784 RepID=UPI000F5FDEEB|nr:MULTISPECIES: hypothetical protein [unclassified Burkholderia]RQZ31594.1 hypothetical protein DIE14_01370 [Burkholderia sp. Bp9017]RQZ37726.1 hypothetical protein DIE13_01360 [Burkholderia sp. Bp9016]